SDARGWTPICNPPGPNSTAGRPARSDPTSLSGPAPAEPNRPFPTIGSDRPRRPGAAPIPTCAAPGAGTPCPNHPRGVPMSVLVYTVLAVLVAVDVVLVLMILG